MKKLFLLFLLLVLLKPNLSAQVHSELWHKVDSIRQVHFPSTYGMPFGTYEVPEDIYVRSQSPKLYINADYSTINGDTKLDSYLLSEIEGLYWIPKSEEAFLAAIFGIGSEHGVIMVYTKDYVQNELDGTATFLLEFP